MRTLYLVSCVSVKVPYRAEAQDLYCSPWFKAARKYVETTGQTWGILSAEHGFVHPHVMLDPYSKTLNDMRRCDRDIWFHRVRHQLLFRYGTDSFDRYVILAGKRYAENLGHYLNAELPLKGLGIGQQLAWFKKNTPANDSRQLRLTA
jgi:hypothetical protein